MLRQILSVGGWTLLSRITGLAREIVMAAILGAGPLMDAFVVANRIPNHFRAIFGEGAFNAAFVPGYARILTRQGVPAARLFSGRIIALFGLTLLVVSALAIAFMPQLVGLLAPGFRENPATFDLAVTLTRITFPYLLFVSLVTLLSGVLNAHERFAAAAAAPILLNVSIVAALAVAFLFPSAAHAAAWGVFAAGLLELALVLAAAARIDATPLMTRPRLDSEVKGFLRRLVPATLGAAGVQIALFADTILVTLSGPGAASSLNYADRLYQLPIGVIGIAAGTVLLPTMSRRLADADEAGAYRAQNRTIGLTLVLAAPFAVAFLLIPTLIMEAVFARGAFDRAAAEAAGAVLMAYAFGLPAIVLIRSAIASFHSRGDTTTPVFISLAAIGLNVALKLVLMPRFGAPGLAFATAAGAWANLGLLYGIALARGWTRPDATLGRTLAAVAAASLALAIAIVLAAPAVTGRVGPLGPLNPAMLTLSALAILGGLAYGGVMLAGARLLRVPLRR